MGEFRVLICMKLNQSGTRNRNFYVTQLPTRGAHFPFPWNTENRVSLVGTETWKTSGRTRAEKNRLEKVEQTGAEQSCVAQEEPHPRAA